jgi:hypothetical protein
MYLKKKYPPYCLNPTVEYPEGLNIDLAISTKTSLATVGASVWRNQ